MHSCLATWIQIARDYLLLKNDVIGYASSHSSGRSLRKSSFGVESICFNTYVSQRSGVLPSTLQAPKREYMTQALSTDS